LNRVSVTVSEPDGDSRIGSRDIEQAVRAALETGFASGREPESAEISVTLLSADRMRALNREYHHVDATTDVLAFDLGSATSEAPSLLGDIYVSPEVATETAAELGLEPAAEVLRLVVHGALHLLGYDHPPGEDRYDSPMFRLQEDVLSGLAVPGSDSGSPGGASPGSS